MNLEQRVQALEQEVQLLKAQIQITLLDVQEQLLNAKYPTLRAGEPEKVAALPAEVRPEISMKSAAPMKTIRIPAESQPDSEIEVIEEEKEKPIVRSNRQRSTPPVEESSAIQPSRSNWEAVTDSISQQQDANSRDWIELENWVSQKVEKLGIKRTRELINLYAQQEQFSRRERELLMQFVGIYGESLEKPQSRLPYPNTELEDTHPTIVPQTRAVVEEIRAELRQKQNAKKSREAVSQPLNEHQELVLRLIAGILNAGDEVSPNASKNGHRNY